MTCPHCGEYIPDQLVAWFLGAIGGSRNTPAQQAQREKVIGKGRPKGSKNKPKPVAPA